MPGAQHVQEQRVQVRHLGAGMLVVWAFMGSWHKAVTAWEQQRVQVRHSRTGVLDL